MENSSALLLLVGSFLSPLPDPDPLQLASASSKAVRSTSATIFRRRSMSIITGDSSFPLLLLAAPPPSYRTTRPGDKPVVWHDSCVQHRESPTDWPLPACRHTR